MRLGVHVVVSYSLPEDWHCCRKTGTAAGMSADSPRFDDRCELLTLVESKTCGFREVGMENAIPIGTRLSKVQEYLGTMNAYTVDARDQPRFKMETDIRIYSRSCGLLMGRTVDISESGIAAMLTLEAPVGEILELEFTLPSGPVAIHAMVRQKNAFRYGFEFVDTDSLHEVIRRTCRDLAVDQSLSSNIQ